MGLLCVMGVGSGVTNPLIATVLQSRTPSDVLGRVFGTLSAGAMLATPLGMLLGGLVISRFGIEASFLICGGTVIAVLVFCLLSPSLRELDAPPLDHAPCVSPKQDAELAA